MKKKIIIMVALAVILAGTVNIAFGMQQKRFQMPDGTIMFFNMSDASVDPYSKIPIAAYLLKRKTDTLLPVLVAVKTQENPIKWELFSPDGLEAKLQSDPKLLSDTNYLTANVYFFLYDASSANPGSFLCNGTTVFKSAGNDTAQAYRNLVFGKYSPACNRTTQGCDLMKMDQTYKYGADGKTILPPLEVMKTSTAVIMKNDSKMYNFIKPYLLKYSSLTSLPTLRPYNFKDANDKLYASLLYKEAKGANAAIPYALEEDLNKKNIPTNVLVLLDTKSKMIGLIIYSPQLVNQKNFAAITDIVAKPENKEALFKSFEEAIKKENKYDYITIDTTSGNIPSADIPFFKKFGFTESEVNKAMLGKKLR